MRFRHNLIDEAFIGIDNMMRKVDSMIVNSQYPSGGCESNKNMYGGFPQSDMLSSLNITQVKKQPLIDIKDGGDNIVVTIDLPGVKKENIRMRLVNPRSLEIEFEERGDREDKKENYYYRERAYGYVKREISLPFDVTDIGAKTSFINGVLDIRFKKIQVTDKEYLKIE
jgi:HSP20 family molecular chaperone IbpA